MTRRLTLRAAIAAAALAGAGCDSSFDIGLEGFIYTMVSAGGSHTCGLAPDGDLYCWGEGRHGEIGDGGGMPRWTPSPVPLPHAVIHASAGQAHTCAVTDDHSLWCWGSNDHGELGIGDAPIQGYPARIESDIPFAFVSSGRHHTCAISTDGVAYCWGRNGQGQLGTGTIESVAEPTAVDTDLRFHTISAGGFHTCAITVDSQPYCWGLNHYGQLGTGTPQSSLTPVRVAGNQQYRAIAAGYVHSCGAASGSGQLYCWGSSLHGEVGTGAMTPEGTPGSLSPAAAPGVVDVVAVAAGTYVSCAVMGSRPVCWGRGDFGQLGLGNRRDHGRAQPVGEIDHVFDGIAVGGTHACGVSRHRGAYCWGEGWSGQLGTGTAVSLVPSRVFWSGRP